MTRETSQFPLAPTLVCAEIMSAGKASGNIAQWLPLIPAGCYAPTDNKK